MVDFTKKTYHYLDSIIQLDAPVSEIIKDLLDIQESVDEKHRDDLEMYIDYGEDFYGVHFRYLRDKTEQELALEEAQRVKYQEYRRQQYEELKKEFEGE